MAAMQPSPSRTSLFRQIEPPRIVAAGFVLLAHVVLLMSLRLAMGPSFPEDDVEDAESTLIVEFVTTGAAQPPVIPVTPTPRRAAVRPRREPEAPVSTTSVEFFDAAPDVGPALSAPVPRGAADDVFDARARDRPFPREPLLSSDLPKSPIRLPDRPSMMQAYWAVPEGENLQGRIVRKVPIVGLLLAATGAIGLPHCPPKSEHPDCLQRLIDGKPP